MNTITSESLEQKLKKRPARAGLKAKLVMRMLEGLHHGTLEMMLPDGASRTFTAKNPSTTGEGLNGLIVIHDWSTFAAVVDRGDIGFGEAYMQGMWSTPDLGALIRLVAANRQAIDALVYGRWWATLIDQLRHLLRSNRKAQARKNISAHYDLGNSFYKLWLDPSMTYSSALFDGRGAWGEPIDLERGQHQKIDRAIKELGTPKRVLEIGCGWAGLAKRLIDTTGCSYVGLTLSSEQREWGLRFLGQDGRESSGPTKSSNPIEIRLQDYRDTNETFDGIVSIEMFEAVGERYWDAYFQTIKRCLARHGIAVIQTITIDEPLFERYRKGTDFIQQYVFPGGMLPSKKAFIDAAQKAGLKLERQFFFGQDYARTLFEWRQRFDQAESQIKGLGFNEEFIRMWRFYLAYCEAGFAQSNIDVGQFTLAHQA